MHGRDQERKGSSQQVRRAHIVLKADADGPSWTDGVLPPPFIAAFKPSRAYASVWSPRGLHGDWRASNARLLRPRHAWMVTGSAADSDAVPSPGWFWTMDVAVVGRPTGCRRSSPPSASRRASDAKKNGMTKRMIAYWVIPPEADAALVTGMENVLDISAKPLIRAIPCGAWTNSRGSRFVKRAPPCPRRRRILHASTMHTNERAPRVFLCLSHRLRGFDRPPHVRSARKWLGRWRWRICSTHGMPTAIG